TTAHSVKFMNKLLGVMGFDKSLKKSYLAMDNCSIHKSRPIIRKLEMIYCDLPTPLLT
ncbi:hypothetical protein J3Q64DRAFT_1634218, partial [Phycomyces blakesleeanus]